MWALAGLVAGAVLGLGPGSAAADCATGQSLSDCTLSGFSALLSPSRCPSTSAGQPAATTAAVRLQELIEEIPCPESGRVSFATADDLGNPMGVLDVVADPAGGYLGVYHTTFGSTRNALDYRISLAHSRDLIHWHRVAVLDPVGASMPTLRAVPGAGYVLAYEKAGSARAGHVIRLRYYATEGDLVIGRFAAQRDLPLRFSQYNNGTPSILSIRWAGSLRRSAIQLGFHYETDRRGTPGPDREALGTLRGFRRWGASPDRDTDLALDQQGLGGSHGDWRQFTFAAARWRLYEAQARFNDFSSWQVVLNGAGRDSMHRLTLKHEGTTVSSSFGNPVAQELAAPQGNGRVLVVTMYLFSASVPGQAGELVYYQPL